jgi:hypothetical protein
MREVAGDLALMLSCCVGSPMNMWFWMRMSGRRRRGGGLYELSQRRGWGSSYSWRSRNGRRIDDVEDEDEDGVAMIRRGLWGNSQEEDEPRRSDSSSSFGQQRGLLSVAVEFLFGPNDNANTTIDSRQGCPSSEELEKWKFRAGIIMSLAAASEGRGVTLRELLPYTDNPPASASDASALRETMKIVTYFNGKPADNASSEASGGIDAPFFFPEIMAEMENGIFDVRKIMSLGSSDFAPPTDTAMNRGIANLLYKNSEDEDGVTTSGSIPQYFYERPKFLTHLSKQQFGQCLFLGTLNFIGVISVQSALMPGGLFDLSIAAAMATDADNSGATMSPRHRRHFNRNMWISFGSVVVLKLLKVLRFYANLFFLLPLIRLVILMFTNYCIDRRNQRRLSFVTE